MQSISDDAVIISIGFIVTIYVLANMLTNWKIHNYISETVSRSHPVMLYGIFIISYVMCIIIINNYHTTITRIFEKIFIDQHSHDLINDMRLKYGCIYPVPMIQH